MLHKHVYIYIVYVKRQVFKQPDKHKVFYFARLLLFDTLQL